MVAVLSRMPFAAEETEAQTSHRILFEEIISGNQVLLADKNALKEVVSKITEHFEGQGEDPDVDILDHKGR